MITAFIYLGVILLFVLLVFYSERKLPAFMQDRIGPMQTGKWGVLQGPADLLKLLQKEDIIPAGASVFLFAIAPFLIFFAIFLGFSVMPFTPGMVPSGAATGVFFMLAIISFDVMGLLAAGWGSNNKYALLGAFRAVAQIISYEIPLGLSVLAVALIAGSLNLHTIGMQQGIGGAEPQYLLGIKALGVSTDAVGGFLTWNIFKVPVLIPAFFVFFIAALAECNRAPFDLPEAESELISGYHAEYSGFRFSVFFLSEYAMMVLVCLAATVLFLGAWHTPFPNMGVVRLANWTSGTPGTLAGTLWGSFWLFGKAFVLLVVQIWVRWTFPRLRTDRLMNLCWKELTPWALITIMLCAVWRLLMI